MSKGPRLYVACRGSPRLLGIPCPLHRRAILAFLGKDEHRAKPVAAQCHPFPPVAAPDCAPLWGSSVRRRRAAHFARTRRRTPTGPPPRPQSGPGAPGHSAAWPPLGYAPSTVPPRRSGPGTARANPSRSSSGDSGMASPTPRAPRGRRCGQTPSGGCRRWPPTARDDPRDSPPPRGPPRGSPAAHHQSEQTGTRGHRRDAPSSGSSPAAPALAR
jgi:hypothetical protein